MNKEAFETILNTYQGVSKDCQKFVDLFNKKPDLSSFTLGELTAVIEQARVLQSKTDTILTAELYHIIGMGNLDAVQTVRLCSVVKAIAASRSYFKPFSCYTLPKLPAVPDKSDYTCPTSKIKLKSEFQVKEDK